MTVHKALLFGFIIVILGCATRWVQQQKQWEPQMTMVSK